MTDIEKKTHRLSQIETLLLDSPDGLTQSELARRLGVHRSTIHRNLVDIPIPIYQENNRLYIDKEAYLVNLRLNLHEVLFIHLAGRLMTTHMDRKNPHAASTIRKLGITLESLAPQISRFIRESANTFDNESKRPDQLYTHVLEIMTSAWARNRKLLLRYRSHENGPIKEYIFAPYFIEVGAFGQSLYAIGKIYPSLEFRTFKIERVTSIELLDEPYQIPEDFDPEVLLNNAWGVWFTDSQPVEVVLKFSQNVAQRVKETRWHPSQIMIENTDGSIIWKGMIAEPREMLPWIRGWGAGVEVLTPENLRIELRDETLKMAKTYGIVGE